MPSAAVITSGSPDETRALGRRLGGLIWPGGYICLYGELGAGKTTFAQGLAEGLGVGGEYVTSPSFALVNEYEGRIRLYHIDLYRLSGPAELDGFGFFEYPGDGVAAVEWPERAGGGLPDERLDVKMEYSGEGARRVELAAHGKRYEELIEALCPGSR